MTPVSGRNLALATGSVLLTLVLLEWGARSFLDPPRYYRRSPFVEFDAELGHRGVPGYRDELSSRSGDYVFALNAQGFRGPDFPEEGSPQRGLRLAFVGDSFLVGRSVREEELLTSRVQAELADRAISARTYNLSVIDYGTGQELLLLERWASLLRPAVVVLALYPGNDLVNNAIELAGRTRVSPGDLIRPYVSVEGNHLRVRYLHPLRAWARRHLRLFALLERRLLSFDPSWGIEEQGASGAELMGLGGTPRQDLELFRAHDPQHPWEVAWRRTESLLLAFRDRCQALGARLLVLVIPMEEQVERTPESVRLDIETLRRVGQPLEELIDWNLPERRLAAFLAGEHIDARFLLMPLRTAARNAADVYTQDAHLGPTGHRIAARSVVRWMLGETDQDAEASGVPTRRLPAASVASAYLDFRFEDHRDHLGGGWIVWRPDRGDGAPWGWWTAPALQLVLPARSGPLVLRGQLPPDSHLPVVLRIRGARTHTARIAEPGPFEIRLPASTKPMPTSSEGYVSLRLEARAIHEGRGGPTELILHGIGFEEDGARAPAQPLDNSISRRP